MFMSRQIVRRSFAKYQVEQDIAQLILLMEAPYTLATLPKLLDTDHGRTRASPVVQLHGSRKRKRQEIVVGIDGESINIYSVNAQSQALHSSYPISPQSYLCCAPTAVYTKSSNTSSSQRDTFAVLRNGPQDRRRRLVRYTESIRTSHSSESSQPSKSEHNLRDGNVLDIEALPSGSLSTGSSPRALVTYGDGVLVCVASGMSSTAWTQSIVQDDIDKDAAVEFAAYVEPLAAEKGLFKNRADLFATFQASQVDSPVLGCFVIRRSDSLILRLCAVSTAPSRSGVQQLGDLQLPLQNVAIAKKWELNAAASQLCCLGNGAVTSFDLSGLVPRAGVTIRDRRAPIEAFSIISLSTFVTVSENRVALHDSLYGSDQGFILLDDITTTSRKKRKRGNDSVTNNVPVLCSYAETGTIALVSTNLTGIQLRPHMVESQQDKSSTILLSDVIGKGVSKHLSHTTHDGDKVAQQELGWYNEVEELVASADTHAVEVLIEENFDITSAKDEDGLWSTEDSPIDLGAKRYRRALIILERLFVPIQASLDAPARLHLRLMSRNIVRWLTLAGLLSSKKLTTVLGVRVSSVNIAAALGSVDPSFQLLQDVLAMSIHLPASFVVECLRILIRSLDTSPLTTLPALQAPESDPTSEQPDARLEQESRSAEIELSNALVALQSGLETRSATMRCIFGRLHAIPYVSLRKHLRTGLEQQDLLFFIHLLRMELADAGWTERYVDGGDVSSDDIDMAGHEGIEDEPSPSDSAIRTIGNLLIAAVDAIGTAGWLVGLDNDQDDGYGLLDALRAEIAAGVEGAYEAHALAGYLGELERYANALDPHSVPKSSRQSSKAIIELAAPASSSPFVGGDNLMPMGGRSSVVSSRREPMSHVERLRARSAMTGLYQLERIRV